MLIATRLSQQCFRWPAFYAERLSQDYSNPFRTTTKANSRLDTVEKRDVLLRFQELRHPFELRTMPPGHESGGIEIAAVPDLGGIGIALQQERLAAGARSAQAARQENQKYSPGSHAPEATPPSKNRKCR
jgi:hypothetical protein